MAKKFFLSMIFCVLSVLTVNAVNPQYQKFMGLKYKSPCANFKPGKFQSISGKFDGKNYDTLTLFPLDGDWDLDTFYYDEWIIISKNGTIPSLKISSFYPELVYEGDLDGNGKDEFGVMLTGQMGCWVSYVVYAYYQGKENVFLDLDWYDNDEDPTSIVRKGSSKGTVIINYYEWDKNMENIKRRTKTKKITKFL